MQNAFRDEMTRRGAFAATAAAALSVAARRSASAAETTGCRVGPAPHPKGPLVFRDYDQIELDANYTQLSYAPMAEQIQSRRATNSAEVRRRLGAPMRVSYGPSDVEKLDIFRSKTPNAPTLVFAHGGAWLGGEANEYHFPAEMFVDAGANYIALDFIAVGAANGNLGTMAEQVQRAFVWTCKNATSFGGDPDKIYVGGASSGAHLAGVALVSDWAKFALPADCVKGGLLISGMYDMTPVRLSTRSSYVKFDDAMEDAMSTIRHVRNLSAPVTLVYGTYETPEFQRQSRDFAAAAKAAGKEATLIAAPNHNHFEMQETLANPYGWAGRAALAMMKLAPA